MRTLILCLCFTFSLIAETYAQQTNIELPDYTKWQMRLDHLETYVYKGRDVRIRDQHYLLEQATVRSLVLLYFTENDNGNDDDKNQWFAIHMVYNLNANELHGFLFERKNESWLFIQNLSRNDLEDMATVFKSRYDLVKK